MQTPNIKRLVIAQSMESLSDIQSRLAGGMNMNRFQRYTKYGNVKTEIDGIKFDSLREARRWRELTLLERAGEISHLERQKRFKLTPTMRDRNGKVLERPSYYIADFYYKDKDGKEVVEDAKGYKTPEYVLKRKLMLCTHAIRIKEV